VINSNSNTFDPDAFRIPLGIISSSAEILEHYFERLDTSRRREHFQDIQTATKQVSELLERLLTPVQEGATLTRPAHPKKTMASGAKGINRAKNAA